MATDSSKAAGVRTIKASEFKAKCLKLMDEVEESGEEIIITKNGRPVSRLAPYREMPKSWFGRDRAHHPDSRRHRRTHRRGMGSRDRQELGRSALILLDTQVLVWDEVRRQPDNAPAK